MFEIYKVEFWLGLEESEGRIGGKTKRPGEILVVYY
jgi:hypothetical protein